MNSNSEKRQHQDSDATEGVPRLRAIITGGSQGLGRALAFSLGNRGYELCLIGRGEAALDTTIRELRVAGYIAHGIAADVGVPRDCNRIAAMAHRKMGGVDLLIHNASTLGPTPLLGIDSLRDEDFRKVLEVNLLGPHRLTKALVGAMVLQGHGQVVFISSDVATQTYENWGGYGVSKVAQDYLAKQYQVELGQSGVNFVAIDPGEMNTAMHKAAIPDADLSVLRAPKDVAEGIALALHQNLAPTSRIRLELNQC